MRLRHDKKCRTRRHFLSCSFQVNITPQDFLTAPDEIAMIKYGNISQQIIKKIIGNTVYSCYYSNRYDEKIPDFIPGIRFMWRESRRFFDNGKICPVD
jgi:hypothetical protein